MFRPLLVLFRLSSRELKVLPYILWEHVMERFYIRDMLRNMSFLITYYAIKPGCTDLSIITRTIYRVIKKDGLNWTANGASTHARQFVAVFQFLCSLCGLSCVGYVQNCLEFFSRSPLTHVVGRSFCLYTDSLFAQIGDSKTNALPRWRLNVKRRRNGRCTAVADWVVMNSRTQKILCCIVAILLSTEAAARLCDRRAL